MPQAEHSAILSTIIKLPFVINYLFVLSIFKWPFWRFSSRRVITWLAQWVNRRLCCRLPCMRPTRHQDRHQTGRVLRRTHKQERRDETSEKKYKKNIRFVLHVETLATVQNVHTKSSEKCIMRHLCYVRIQKGRGRGVRTTPPPSWKITKK